MNLKDLKKNSSVKLNDFGSRNKSDLSFRLDSKEIKPQKKKLGKILRILLSILTLIVISIASFLGYFYIKNYNFLRNIGTENINFLDPFNIAIDVIASQNSEPLSKLEKTDNNTNFLLLGVDSRGGFTSFRTDSIILASYKHSTKEVVEFSIPRDMQALYRNSYMKVNSVFQFAYNDAKSRGLSDENAMQDAFDKLKDSINYISGLQIHYGVMVNFNALKDIVDALGGITVNVDKPLFDNLYPNDSDTGTITINFSVGEQKMNGTRALQYSRSRQTTSDYDRARRQQQVVNAIRDKFVNSNFFTDVNVINDLIDAISRNVRFFNINSAVLGELIAGREVLNSVNVASVVLDPTIGSFTGQVLAGGEPIAGAGFLVYPVGGKYDSLQKIVRRYLEFPGLLRENATLNLVYTDRSRFRDFDSVRRKLLEDRFSYLSNGNLITIRSTASPTPTVSPTIDRSKNISVYFNGDNPVSRDYYINYLRNLGYNVEVKSEENLPEELKRSFDESNILLAFG
jgi:LCP family protein required for cell wall assembly